MTQKKGRKDNMAMEKFWLFGKKSEPAAELDEDYDTTYYGEPEVNETSNVADHTDDDGIRVVVSTDVAQPVAVAEPLLKRTFTPNSHTDSAAIVDAFKDGRVVVIYVEELDKPSFIRLFDYIMGAVQALDGTFKRVDRETAVLLPYDVDEKISIDELDEEIVEEDDDEAEKENGD